MGKRRTGINPGTGVSKYTGPVSLPATSGSNATMTTLLTGTANVLANGSGDFKALFTTAGAPSLTEWTAWSTLYQEYRILGIRFEFMPTYHDGFVSTTITPPLGIVAPYHEDSFTIPSTMAAAVEISTAKPWSTSKPLTIEWKMDSLGESNFFPTSTTSSFGGILVFTEGGSAAAPLGRYFVRYLVQFKGRK